MDQEDSQSIAQAQQAVNEISGIQMEYKNGNQELSLLGFIKMQIPLGLINFSRFLMMIFGLAITWFLMFWAVKYTKLGAQIGGQLESLGSKLLSTTPLIPVNGKMVGFGALAKEMSEKVNNITQAMRQEHDKRVAKAFGNAPKDGEDFTQEYFYGGVS